MALRLRPFHETVVQSIESASAADMVFLGFLLVRTEIPANHDAIIKAWQKRERRLGLQRNVQFIELLEAQKETAKKEHAKQ